MFPRVYFAARYFAPRYFGGAAAEVVEPPVPAPEQRQPSGGGFRPSFLPRPPQPVIGDIYAVLPSLEGKVAGEIIWGVSGDVAGAVWAALDGEVDGVVPNFGSAEGTLGMPSVSIKGTTKALHDDEELLLVLHDDEELLLVMLAA